MSERAKDRTVLRAKDSVLPAELIPMAATAEQLGFLRAPDPCCPAGDGGQRVHGDAGHGEPPPEEPEDENEGHQHMRVFPVFNLNERGEIVESVDREGRLSAGTKRALAESKRKRPEGAGGKGHAADEEGGHAHAKPAPTRKPRKKR